MSYLARKRINYNIKTVANLIIINPLKFKIKNWLALSNEELTFVKIEQIKVNRPYYTRRWIVRQGYL
jgi:hypothetical protein